jgi:Holliday junction resolvase-like predicted endonuclease
MNESANRITANILRVINMQPGCVAYRINNVGVWDAAKGVHRKGNTQKGLPDIIACLRGKFVAIEVKSGNDKQSDWQKIVEQEISGAKGEYWIIRSTENFLENFEKWQRQKA